MFGWLAALLRGLWNFSRASWVDVGQGLRPGSPASALYLFLFLLFCIIGGALMLLGFDLADVDIWLDRHGNWFEVAGTIAFKLVCLLILLLSLLAAGSGVYFQLRGVARWVIRLVSPPRAEGEPATRRGSKADDEDKPGWTVIVLACILAYFSFFGVFT